MALANPLRAVEVPEQVFESWHFVTLPMPSAAGGGWVDPALPVTAWSLGRSSL